MNIVLRLKNNLPHPIDGIEGIEINGHRLDGYCEWNKQDKTIISLNDCNTLPIDAALADSIILLARETGDFNMGIIFKSSTHGNEYIPVQELNQWIEPNIVITDVSYNREDVTFKAYPDKEYNLSTEEIKTVYDIFDTLRSMTYPKLNTVFGSETIKRMFDLTEKLENHLETIGEKEKRPNDDFDIEYDYDDER